MSISDEWRDMIADALWGTKEQRTKFQAKLAKAYSRYTGADYETVDWNIYSQNSPNLGVYAPVDDGSAANEPDRIADLEATHNEMVRQKDARIAELEEQVARLENASRVYLQARDLMQKAGIDNPDQYLVQFPANALKHSV